MASTDAVLCAWQVYLQRWLCTIGVRDFYASYLPLGVRLGRLRLDTAVPMTFQPIELPLRREPVAEQPSQIEVWTAWPEHTAFVDEIRRWWPSNQLPPIQPPELTVEHRPARRLEVVDRRACGGLLDSWA